MPVPTDISGLSLWFEAEDLSGLGHGASLVTWPDKSGHGRDLTATNGAKEPQVRQELNGQWVVSFDGVDDFMRTPAFPSPTAGVTVFVLAELSDPAGDPTAYRSILLHTSGATWADPYARHCTRVAGVSPNGLECWINQYGAPRLLLETVQINANKFTLYEMNYDLTTLATFRNLAFQAGTVPSTALSSSNFPVHVGANTDGGEPLSGYISSIVVYDRCLTTAERGQVGSHMIGSDADEKVGVTQGGMHV